MKKILFLLFFLSQNLWALDYYEIITNETQINSPGQFNISMTSNYLVSNKSEYSTHFGYFIIEPVMGLADWCEFGLSAQMAMSQDNFHSHINTFGARAKFVNQPADGGSFYQGVNIEVGYVPPQSADEQWSIQWRPFIGFNFARFDFILDSTVGWNFATPSSIDFTPCMKFRINTLKSWGYGLEYYSALGQINQFVNFIDQEHTVLAFAELINSSFDMNVGVGRGITAASSDLIVKAIVSKSF